MGKWIGKLGSRKKVREIVLTFREQKIIIP